jgi:aminoglycoside 3-N-acetyltransferase
VNFRQLIKGFKNLEIDSSRPVLVHASFSSFSDLKGGPEQLVGAMLESFNTLLAPTFTYKTMITPETGPPNNAIEYGNNQDLNKLAEIFYPDMPADRTMSIVAETLRKHPEASRSTHPILSFAGVNAEKYLSTQSLSKPLAPIMALSKDKGYVLLLGVDHTKNTSIHLGEQLAGRKSFTRWALVSDMVAECTGYPSCSDGFNSILPYMSPFINFAKIGDAEVQIMQIDVLIKTVQHLVSSNPKMLLCENDHCPRCQAIHTELERKNV